MVTIGIDIGLKGAIAAIGLNDPPSGVFVWDTPTKEIIVVLEDGSKRTRVVYDMAAIRSIFSCIMIKNVASDIEAYIEKALVVVSGYQIKTNTGLARCQGMFEGILAAFNIRCHLVSPNEWHVHYGLTGKNDCGDENVQTAERLYPMIEYKTKRGRVLDGRADAILIAESCEYLGELYDDQS